MRAVIETGNGRKNGRKQKGPSSAPPVKRRKKNLPGDDGPPAPGTPVRISPER
jgi:hypothetical protein